MPYGDSCSECSISPGYSGWLFYCYWFCLSLGLLFSDDDDKSELISLCWGRKEGPVTGSSYWVYDTMKRTQFSINMYHNTFVSWNCLKIENSTNCTLPSTSFLPLWHSPCFQPRENFSVSVHTEVPCFWVQRRKDVCKEVTGNVLWKS